jgi:hypothetical protein
VAWLGLAFIIDFILSEKACIHSIQSWDGKEVNLVEIVVGREGGREREREEKTSRCHECHPPTNSDIKKKDTLSREEEEEEFDSILVSNFTPHHTAATTTTTHHPCLG